MLAGRRTKGVADSLVPAIAVQSLQARLSNTDLADYLLQLVKEGVSIQPEISC